MRTSEPSAIEVRRNSWIAAVVHSPAAKSGEISLKEIGNRKAVKISGGFSRSLNPSLPLKKAVEPACRQVFVLTSRSFPAAKSRSFASGVPGAIDHSAATDASFSASSVSARRSAEISPRVRRKSQSPAPASASVHDSGGEAVR